MKVLIHGFGDTPLFTEEVVKLAQETNPEIKWYYLLPRSYYLKEIAELVGSDHVVNLAREMEKLPFTVDTSVLENYPHNIFLDLESDKGYLAEKSARSKLDHALRIYTATKNYLLKIKPDYILYPGIQNHDGVILFHLAEELNIQNVSVRHTRHIGLSFFSDTLGEKLPPYASVTEQDVSRARAFLEDFRSSDLNAFNFSPQPGKVSKVIPVHRPSFIKRCADNLHRLAGERDFVSFKQFRDSLKRSRLRWFFLKYIAIRRILHRRFYTISSIEELPPKFVYYPLQFTPESTISIPAPEYNNQRKAIDAIRFSMENDVLLVVKEHPACLGYRPATFIKDLLKTAGVVVAKYDLSSNEIIKKADMVISVTGSATIEAFLHGRPSLSFGGNFYTEFWGELTSLSDLPDRLKAGMGKKIDDDYIIQCVAKIFNVSYPFILRAVGEKKTQHITMSESNIKEFLNAFLDHIKRLQNVKSE